MVLLRHRNERAVIDPGEWDDRHIIGMAGLIVRAVRHSDYPDRCVAPTIILSAAEKAHTTRRDLPGAQRGGSGRSPGAGSARHDVDARREVAQGRRLSGQFLERGEVGGP